MNLPRRRLLLAALLALAGAGLWFWLAHPQSSERTAAAAPPTTTPTVSELPRPIARANATHHPLADRLNHPDQDARADVLAVEELLRLFAQAVRGMPRRPLGTNAEFTAALAGANPLRLTFLPPGHPAINTHGELCDRWGHAYLFNPMSEQRVDIRSAGPDGKQFTSDDITVREPTGLEP
ncbi:MAG: hypothetical protein IPL39_20765 [Opitutaceae bacterium]|nr:hypothetical protein [Opitutaceae bacterium]